LQRKKKKEISLPPKNKEGGESRKGSPQTKKKPRVSSGQEKLPLRKGRRGKKQKKGWLSKEEKPNADTER